MNYALSWLIKTYITFLLFFFLIHHDFNTKFLIYHCFLLTSFIIIGYNTFWIDVCQSDGNLLASGGGDENIKIYDRRESKIVRIFDDIHSGMNN